MLCDGVGLVRTTLPGGVIASRPCQCQIEQRVSLALRRAAIPARYEHCTLDNFDSAYPGADPSLAAAHILARGFATNYPLESRGLLLVGSIGAGKTHLAVGALKAVIEDRGAQGLFCDYRELLRLIQNSYNPQVSTTELEILNPVVNAEVLVLDDLGAIRPTEWVWDTVSVILNSRYNDKRTTIITTNYPALAPGVGGLREETLGDRIGERMRSRLMEMCNQVEMTGKDFRQTALRARLVPEPMQDARKAQPKPQLAKAIGRKI
jgi:DNA replication protein DnaC